MSTRMTYGRRRRVKLALSLDNSITTDLRLLAGLSGPIGWPPPTGGTGGQQRSVGQDGTVTPEEMADAARILDALADEIDAGVVVANARDARYLRGAAAALRSAATDSRRRR
jgi:hypothetical protein